MLGPNVRTYGDVQIAPTLEPMQLQARLNEVLDMLVEACAYKAGCADELSKVTKQKKCMQLIDSALNFRVETEGGGGHNLRQDGTGAIGPDDLVYLLLETDNPLRSWFTTMLGPAHRRAFLQFCLAQAGFAGGTELDPTEKIRIPFLLKILEECLQFRF